MSREGVHVGGARTSGSATPRADARRRGPAERGGNARGRFAFAGLTLAAAMGLAIPALSRMTAIAPETAAFAVSACVLVGLGLSLGHVVDALERRTLEDPMTCVSNRRHLEQRLHVEVARALATHMPLAMLMVDLDNLKGLNDAHGHACGDRALGLVAEVLRDTCRSRDLAARFGGDEFAVLLPRTRVSEARIVAERIRSELAHRRTTAGLPESAVVTVSIGVADLDIGRNGDSHKLFEAADRALYAAKAKGRDRIEVEPAPRSSGVIRLDERRAARKGTATA